MVKVNNNEMGETRVVIKFIDTEKAEELVENVKLISTGNSIIRRVILVNEYYPFT